METQSIREAKSLHPIEPIRNNLLVRYTFEAKGMIIVNAQALKDLTPIEKVVVGYGETTDAKFKIGVNIVTKFDCFSLQPTNIEDNELSIKSTLNKLKKFQPIGRGTAAGKLLLTPNDTADEVIDLNRIYTMYEYYLINEGDILAINKNKITVFPTDHTQV